MLPVKEWISQNVLIWPFNFKGDKCHLNFIKKANFLEGSSLANHKIHLDKVLVIRNLRLDQNGHETKKIKIAQKKISSSSPPLWWPSLHIKLTWKMWFDWLKIFTTNTNGSLVYIVQLEFMIYSLFCYMIKALVLALLGNQMWRLKHLGIKGVVILP